VEKNGAWFSFGDERIGQGRQNVKRFLAENTDIRDKIRQLVIEKSGLGEITKKVDTKGEKKDSK
jgi:recombination protein RecA